MRICPGCNSKNPDDSRFCESCGKSLDHAMEEGPVGSVPPGPTSVGGDEIELESPEPSAETQDITPGEVLPPERTEVVVPPPQQQPPTPSMDDRPATTGYTPSEPPRAVPPPPQVSPPPAYVSQPGASARTSQTALWSMILGIASLVFCCGLTGPIAIALAVQARKEPSVNEGMATAGMVTGIIGTSLLVLGIIGFVIAMLVGATTP